eukprot:Transcript_19140.p3 GENE.Transcript_19140~~Transcript_19140.p3  ORF type:complete len:353 (-),score=104.70 Transcript_19140:44-1102(-)
MCVGTEHERLPSLTRSATAGRVWLTEMGAAAAEAGVSVQYCMCYVRHVLQAVESPAVTQARGSGDYRAGNEQWRPLGLTSLLLYALGLAASKDNFWSTKVQRGNKWGDATVEPHSALQAAVATLSRGPVMPSDAVGHSDASLIKRSAMADGTLLHPGTPAVLVDAAVLALAQGRRIGEVWLATTTVSGRTFGSLFAAHLSRDLAPSELGLDAADLLAPVARLAAMEARCTAPRGTACRVERAGPPTLRRCGSADFQLWSLAPLEADGWSLLGEVNKWVGVSPARVRSIEVVRRHSGNASLVVAVRGAPGELVALAFAPPARTSGAWAAAVVECTVPSSGALVVAVPERSCVL